MSFELFVLKSHRATAKSVSEAFRTPDYACAIQRPRNDFWEWIKSF